MRLTGRRESPPSNTVGALFGEGSLQTTSAVALVARIVADYAERRDSLREAAWIAELDGAPVGCVLCVRKDEITAQLRLLLVEPVARGMGIGAQRRLLRDRVLDRQRAHRGSADL